MQLRWEWQWIIGVSFMASVESYIFRSFLKTIILVITLGTLHGLLILPTLLTMFSCSESTVSVFIRLFIYYPKPLKTIKKWIYQQRDPNLEKGRSLRYKMNKNMTAQSVYTAFASTPHWSIEPLMSSRFRKVFKRGHSRVSHPGHQLLVCDHSLDYHSVIRLNS